VRCPASLLWTQDGGIALGIVLEVGALRTSTRTRDVSRRERRVRRGGGRSANGNARGWTGRTGAGRTRLSCRDHRGITAPGQGRRVSGCGERSEPPERERARSVRMQGGAARTGYTSVRPRQRRRRTDIARDPFGPKTRRIPSSVYECEYENDVRLAGRRGKRYVDGYAIDAQPHGLAAVRDPDAAARDALPVAGVAGGERRASSCTASRRCTTCRRLPQPIYAEGLRNSCAIAAGSTLLAAGLSVPLAWLSHRYRFPGRGVFGALVLVPMILPPFVGAIGLLQIFGPLRRGQRALRAGAGGLAGTVALLRVIALQGAGALPDLYLNVAAALANIDPAMEEAAANLGSGTWTTFRRVDAAADDAGALCRRHAGVHRQLHRNWARR